MTNDFSRNLLLLILVAVGVEGAEPTAALSRFSARQ